MDLLSDSTVYKKIKIQSNILCMKIKHSFGATLAPRAKNF